jgi:hypothetical protein
MQIFFNYFLKKKFPPVGPMGIQNNQLNLFKMKNKSKQFFRLLSEYF